MSDNGTSTAVAERPARQVDLVRAALERMKPQLEMALPRHLTAERLLRVAMTAVQTTPKLLECDRTSLYRAIMSCAQLGLEPDGVLGQAYLIPFAGKVQFIPGYRGLLSLARNSGDVTSIAAHEIREHDKFEFDFASGEPPKHTFDLRQERGHVIAFYAVARFRDGSFHWDMMTRAEVERIRDGSQGYQAAMRSAKKYSKEPDTPWVNHYVEMGKKTVIRRIAKYLPMSVQKAAAMADAYDTGRHVSIDTHGELVIDGEATEHDDDAPQIENRSSQLDRFEEAHAAEPALAASATEAQTADREDPFGLPPLKTPETASPPAGDRPGEDRANTSAPLQPPRRGEPSQPRASAEPEAASSPASQATPAASDAGGRTVGAIPATGATMPPRSAIWQEPSYAIEPPVVHATGAPDWAQYGRSLAHLAGEASEAEIAKLRADNKPHLDRMRRESGDAYRELVVAFERRVAEIGKTA